MYMETSFPYFRGGAAHCQWSCHPLALSLTGLLVLADERVSPLTITPCLDSGSIPALGKSPGLLWVSILPIGKIGAPACLCDDESTSIPMIMAVAWNMTEHCQEGKMKERDALDVRLREALFLVRQEQQDRLSVAGWCPPETHGDESSLLGPWLTCW